MYYAKNETMYYVIQICLMLLYFSGSQWNELKMYEIVVSKTKVRRE